jgi:TonB family protein
MKQLILWLSIALAAGVCPLTAQSQSGRITRDPAAPATAPISEPPAKPIAQQNTAPSANTTAKIEYPEFVDGERIYKMKEINVRPVVRKKPEAEFTSKAHDHGIEGVVKLRAIFAANGDVKVIGILQSLPYGLDQSAIKAAKKIKFEPALKDGRPVSVWAQLEYYFSW